MNIKKVFRVALGATCAAVVVMAIAVAGMQQSWLEDRQGDAGNGFMASKAAGVVAGVLDDAGGMAGIGGEGPLGVEGFSGTDGPAVTSGQVISRARKTLVTDDAGIAMRVASEVGCKVVELPLTGKYTVEVPAGYEVPVGMESDGSAKLAAVTGDLLATSSRARLDGQMAGAVEDIEEAAKMQSTHSSVFDTNDPAANFMTQLWFMDPDDVLKTDMKGTAGKLGRKVRVAVIDTGIDVDHPEFTGKISALSKNIHTGSVYGSDASGADDLDDPIGHGTQVAGVIAANKNNGTAIAGIADDVELVVIRIGYIDEDGDYALPNSEVTEGLKYAASVGADVVNMSMTSASRTKSDPYGVGVAACKVANATLVVAAGNDGEGVTEDGKSYWPAADLWVITVGAIDGYVGVSEETNPCSITYYSNYGDEVDVWAPGMNTSTSRNGGQTFGAVGTSFASPDVAAVIARYLDANGAVSPSLMKQLLVETSSAHLLANEGVGDGASAGTDESLPTVSIGNLMACAPTDVMSEWGIIDDSIYSYDTSGFDKVATLKAVNAYRGDGGEVSVPGAADGKDVDLVLTRAFKTNSTVTSVTLPASLRADKLAYTFVSMPALTGIDARAVKVTRSSADFAHMAVSCAALKDAKFACTAENLSAFRIGTWREGCDGASASFKHNWGEWTTIEEPDCTHVGVERMVCSNDAAHVQERTLPALGHEWVDEADSETGEVTDRVCARCKVRESTDIVADAGDDDAGTGDSSGSSQSEGSKASSGTTSGSSGYVKQSIGTAISVYLDNVKKVRVKAIKKHRVKVKWNKAKGAKWYVIKVTCGKKKVKTITVSAKKLAKKIKIAKRWRGKKLKVKVASVAKADGMKVYGKWSKAKKVQVR